MRNQYAKALLEGRNGHFAHRVHGEAPRRRPTKQELLEEAIIQDDLLDEDWSTAHPDNHEASGDGEY